MPSIMPSSVELKARYGLHDESGQRYSIRLVSGRSLYIGMRIDADRLRLRIQVAASKRTAPGRVTVGRQLPCT